MPMIPTPALLLLTSVMAGRWRSSTKMHSSIPTSCLVMTLVYGPRARSVVWISCSHGAARDVSPSSNASAVKSSSWKLVDGINE